jgi:hypothetical protein
MSTKRPYNPLDKRNLGASVAEALLEYPPVSLGEIRPFTGAGLYAIYYTGDFFAYRRIAERNRDGRLEWPIYVGEAMPKGGRKGAEHPDAPAGPALFKRLTDHGKSIEAAVNLSIEDFPCRYLVVEEIFIALGEALLIAKFAPIWNKIIDGFGNHNPGKGRHAGMRPRWDVLHPGRPWAASLAERPETPEQISADVETYLRDATVPGRPKLMVGD